MSKICTRKETNKLYFDFTYRGKRCREQTALSSTASNIKQLQKVLSKIDAEIILGVFEYGTYFPNSKNVQVFARLTELEQKPQQQGGVPIFREFADDWFLEKEVEWRKSHISAIRCTLDKYILPFLGKKYLDEVTRQDIFTFRAKLKKHPGRDHGTTLSHSRINHIMDPLHMILSEGPKRYKFEFVFEGIKRLKVPKTDVQPFSMQEVQQIINTVRTDFRQYFIIRFFTGMRTSEVHGLQWKNVDFENQKIVIHVAWVSGEVVDVKNDGSYREIDMSPPVLESLKAQQQVTGHLEFVFSTVSATPFNSGNVARRVWYPLLRYLEFDKRRMYQTRHTAATLWLASGESPEWIARQMGHTDTTMLFTVYSRYVPNLRQRDGSAFENMLKQSFRGTP